MSSSWYFLRKMSSSGTKRLSPRVRQRSEKGKSKLTGANGDHDRKLESRRVGQTLPSLKEFVHKQAVIRQYRTFLRVIAMISDSSARLQANEEVKQTFRRHACETDEVSISMTVKEGEKKLKQLKSMVGYVEKTVLADSDSWLNIKDTEDPRGRVGLNWPWENSGNNDYKQ
mmetsp:Transcript_16160/g.23012  ORF Transcript_16160/g.23012 Transcript_16160/m.23012 type:complete len:171 (+) Transcript_16160:107-619(+)